MGEIVFILAIAAVAAVIGLGLGIVLSRTLMQRIADHDVGEDEEPGDRHD